MFSLLLCAALAPAALASPSSPIAQEDAPAPAQDAPPAAAAAAAVEDGVANAGSTSPALSAVSLRGGGGLAVGADGRVWLAGVDAAGSPVLQVRDGSEWAPVDLAVPAAVVGGDVRSAQVVTTEQDAVVAVFHVAAPAGEALWVAEDDGLEWTNTTIALDQDALREVTLGLSGGYAVLTAVREGVGRDAWSGIVRWDQGGAVLAPWIRMNKPIDGLALVHGSPQPLVFYSEGGRLVLLDHTNRERKVPMPWGVVRAARLEEGRPTAIVRDAVGRLQRVSVAPAGPIGQPEPEPERQTLSRDPAAQVVTSADGSLLLERRSAWFAGAAEGDTVLARQGARGPAARAHGTAWAWSTPQGTRVLTAAPELPASPADSRRPIGGSVGLGGGVVSQSVRTGLPGVELAQGVTDPGEVYGLAVGTPVGVRGALRVERVRATVQGAWMVSGLGLLLQTWDLDLDVWRVGPEWLDVVVDGAVSDQRLFGVNGDARTLSSRDGAVSLVVPGGFLLGVSGGTHRGPQAGVRTVDGQGRASGSGDLVVVWGGARAGWRLAQEDLWLRRRGVAPVVELVGEAGLAPSQLTPDGAWLGGADYALGRRLGVLGEAGLEAVLRGPRPGSTGLSGAVTATGSWVALGARERDGVAWLRAQRSWGVQASVGAVW